MCVCQKQGINSSKERSTTATALSRKKREAAAKANREKGAGEDSRRVADIARQAFYTSHGNRKGDAERRPAKRTRPPEGNGKKSANRGVTFAQALQPVAQTTLQWTWRSWVERHQIPQRLAAILAQIGERRGVGVRMAGYVLADGGIGVAAKPLQSLGVRTRMLADQAQEIKILLRSLLREFLKHLRLRVGAQHQPDLFIPRGVDLIQFAGARVDQFFQGMPLLLRARDGQIGSFERVQHAQQVLAFAENDLRSARSRALFLFLVLHQVRTSHVTLLQPATPSHPASGQIVRRKIAKVPEDFSNAIMWRGSGRVKFCETVCARCGTA